MTKQEFLQQLAVLLSDLSVEEREDALHYYSEYFEDAAPASEQEVIEDLGGCEKVANIIRANLGLGAAQNNQNSATATTQPVQPSAPLRGINPILLAIIIILTAPFWLGLVFAALGVSLSMVIVVFALVVVGVCLVAGGIIAIIGVVALFALSPASAIFSIGLGLVCVAIGIVMCMFFGWLLGKTVSVLCTACGNFFRWIFNRNRKVV